MMTVLVARIHENAKRYMKRQLLLGIDVNEIA